MKIQFITKLFKREQNKFMPSSKVAWNFEHSVMVVFDTRSKEKFNVLHLHDAKNVDVVILKDEILKESKEELIILCSEFERTLVHVVTWARRRGYKDIYVLKNLNSKDLGPYLVYS